MKKKIIAILVLCMILIAALIGCSIKPEKRQISAGDDTKLRTLILSDIRFDGSAADSVRERMITRMVKDRNPEFIAISGNIVNGEENGKLMKKAVELIDSFGIPWATSLGELDTKGNTSKKEIIRILTDKKLKNSMVMRGENYGYNYILEIVDYKNKVNNLFYFVDTTEACTDTFVEWYKNTITTLSFKYKEVQGQILNSQVFMNRPLPIYSDKDVSDSAYNYEVHPWSNSISFQNAIIATKSTRVVFAGFDEMTNGSSYKPKDVNYVYVKSLLFDSSMAGTKYTKQKNSTGCTFCEFTDSPTVSVTTHQYNPDNYVNS